MPPRVSKAEKSQKRFYDALTDLFVGVELKDTEGVSGFINLMKIKSRYFREGVFPALQKEVEAGLKPFPDFREELFDKLYSFFRRYFSESGSVYFRHTPAHEQVYERVYTDDRDVMLFWKTRMLYYVKTDRLFRSMGVPVDDVKFWFDVSGLVHKKANEKRSLVFEFDSKRGDGVLVFKVSYSEKGRKTKTSDILKALRKLHVKVSEEVLDKAFRVFERQSEVDYFICKDARAFLREQFDLWFYQYVFIGESTWTEQRIKQLQFLRTIALRIIDFIAQFEDELVKIWNKPKFVRNSNYVITLDRITAMNIGLVERLIAHPGMMAQVKEWQDLGMVGKGFGPSSILTGNAKSKSLKPEYQYLPMDTRHFKDLELEILGQFDDLDDQLDGWLIKSENYQALKTLERKWRERVQCIYIDPPYNTDASEILYANDYKHASWLSLVWNRVEASWDLLANGGVYCVAIDDAEYHRLRGILTDMLDEDRVLGVAAIRSNPAGRSTPKGFSIAHDYAVFMARSTDATIGRLERTPEQEARYSEQDAKGSFEWVNFRKHGGANALRSARPKLFYPIYVTEAGWRIPSMKWDEDNRAWTALEEPRKSEVVLFPVAPDGDREERTWKWGHTSALKRPEEFSVRRDQQGELGMYMKSRLKPGGLLPSTFWTKAAYSATDHGTNLLKAMFGKGQLFSFPKSVHAVADCLRVARLASGQLALDHFAGSGTTGHAVINLNRADGGHRKYALVEMASYFDAVMLPRIKKAVFCEKWKDGKAEGGQGVSHFVKYFELEQYEDVLRRVQYQDGDLLEGPGMDPFSQYVFMRDLKMLHAAEADLEKGTVSVDLSKLYPDIDLAETLANVLGKHIKRITADRVYFSDGTDADLKNPDFKLLRPLLWW